MTDMIEQVARAVEPELLITEAILTSPQHLNRLKAKRIARAAIAAHTAALIAGAGEVERRLLNIAPENGVPAQIVAPDDCDLPRLVNETMRQAAATIATLRAELAGVKEGRIADGITDIAGTVTAYAQGRLEGVRLGIKSAADFIQEFGPSDTIGNQEAAGGIRALSDLIAGDAHLIDTVADSDGDDGA